MGWNKERTEYTPPGGWPSDNKKKAEGAANYSRALQRLNSKPIEGGPDQTTYTPTLTMEKPIAAPSPNSEAFSQALQPQKWSPSTYTPLTPPPTATPSTPVPTTKADAFSQALQRLSSKPYEDSTYGNPSTMGGLPNDVAAPTMAQSKMQADKANAQAVQSGNSIQAYDPSTTTPYKPSLWDKTKSVFSSIFSDNGDIHNQIRAGANELGAGIAKSTGISDLADVALHAPVGQASARIHEQNLESISPGLAKSLNLTGQLGGVVAGGEMLAPAKLLTGLNFLNKAKTATGALKATLPEAELISQQIAKTAFNTAATAGISEAVKGASQPNMQDRNPANTFGAAFRHGTVGVGNVAVGEVAKWRGFDKFGDDQIALGKNLQQGFDAKPEFKGWQSFLDPQFLAGSMGETLPSTLALLPLGLAGGAAGGLAATATKMGPFARTVMQGIGAGAASAPMEAAMEAGQTYEEMRRNGASVEDAKAAGDKVWLHNVALLTATNSAEFGSWFMPKGVNKALGSLPGKLATNAVMEGGEEGLQQWIQNSAQGKPTSLSDPAMQESIGIGALMGMGFGLGGHAHTEHQPTIQKTEQTIQNIKDQVISMLSDEDQRDLQIHIKDAVSQGMTEDQAFNHAMDILANHPDGAQIITQATQQTVENEQIRLQAQQPATGPADYTAGAGIIVKGMGNQPFTVVDSYKEKVRIKNDKGDTVVIDKKDVVGSPINADPTKETDPTQPPADQPEKPQTEQTQIDPGKLQQAKDLVASTGIASVHHLQKNLRMGYTDAANIIDELERQGIVGPYDGAKPREVFQQPPADQLDQAALVDAPEKPASTDAALDGNIKAFLDDPTGQTPVPDLPQQPPTAPPTAPKTPPTPTDQIDFSKGARVTIRGMAPNPFTITGIKGDMVDLQSSQGGTLTVGKKSIHSNYIDPQAVQDAPATTPTAAPTSSFADTFTPNHIRDGQPVEAVAEGDKIRWRSSNSGSNLDSKADYTGVPASSNDISNANKPHMSFYKNGTRILLQHPFENVDPAEIAKIKKSGFVEVNGGSGWTAVNNEENRAFATEMSKKTEDTAPTPTAPTPTETTAAPKTSVRVSSKRVPEVLQTAHIDANGKVTVTAKAKNLDHEMLPRNFDAESEKSLSHSFQMNDYINAPGGANPAWNKKKFMEKQIDLAGINEKHGHHAMIDRIIDAQIDAVDNAIKLHTASPLEKPVDQMTQQELSQKANELRVPAWGKKDKLIQRIKLALKARAALGEKTAADLEAASMADLEKIMFDADMKPTEAGHERNKASHVKRLLEWRDGKAQAEAVSFTDLLKTDVRALKDNLTEEQMKSLEDAQAGKLLSVPYAIHSIHQESKGSRVLAQFLVQTPTPKGYTGVQRIIERDGTVVPVKEDDADEIGMMKPIYGNQQTAKYIKAREPKQSEWPTPEEISENKKDHQDTGGFEVRPGFTVKVGDYVNSSGFSKITGINKAKKTVMLGGMVPVPMSDLLPLETLVTEREKQAIHDFKDNDMAAKYHLLRVAIDTTQVHTRVVIFNTDDMKMGTMWFQRVDPLGGTGQLHLEIHSGPMKIAREGKGPDWQATGRNDKGGVGFVESNFVTLWEIPSEKVKPTTSQADNTEVVSPNAIDFSVGATVYIKGNRTKPFTITKVYVHGDKLDVTSEDGKTIKIDKRAVVGNVPSDTITAPKKDDKVKLPLDEAMKQLEEMRLPANLQDADWLRDHTVAELKLIAKVNGYPRTGTKDELVDKIQTYFIRIFHIDSFTRAELESKKVDELKELLKSVGQRTWPDRKAVHVNKLVTLKEKFKRIGESSENSWLHSLGYGKENPRTSIKNIVSKGDRVSHFDRVTKEDLELGTFVSWDDETDMATVNWDDGTTSEIDGYDLEKRATDEQNAESLINIENQLKRDRFLTDRNRDNWNPTHTYEGYPVEVLDLPVLGEKVMRYEKIRTDVASNKWGKEIKVNDAAEMAKLLPIGKLALEPPKTANPNKTRTPNDPAPQGIPEVEYSNIQMGDIVTFGIEAKMDNEGNVTKWQHVTGRVFEIQTAMDGEIRTPLVRYSGTNKRGDYSKTEQVTRERVVKVVKSTETRSQKIANELKVLIWHGTEVKSGDLFRIADTVYKGTQSEGRYTPKDAYDAMELAVNQYLLEQHEIDLTTTNIEEVKKNVEKLVALVNKLPTQSKRTEGQELFQQFSTPPAIAYVAAWVANITENDTVLEPSAGIGGLALFAKANGAEVIVNELDPRRLDIIKQMPFDQFFKEDGEQINNILPKSIKPAVVIMNPPFSTSATRGVTDTGNSFNHVEQALKRLVPNGRLVAILGQGREGKSKAFDEWIKKLNNDGYSVRAAVAVDGKNYMKYGTTFNVQIVVIDKVQNTSGIPIMTVAGSLEEAINLLGGIANDRRETAPRDQTSEQTSNQPTSGEGSTGGAGTGSSRRPQGQPNSSTQPNAVGDRGSEHTDTEHNNGSSSEPTTPLQGSTDSNGNDEGTNGDGRGNTYGSNDVSGETGTNSGESTGSVGSQEDQPGDNTDEGRPVNKEISDDAFEEYTPKKFKVKGAKRHPGELAESAAMAAIDLPDIKYKFKLPAKFIEEGRLSIAQLEVVAYAGQAHSQMLNDGTTRKGFFVGDGTGLGKGREMVGIILDNFAQGRTKAVWVSENRGLLNDAKRDWMAFDGDPKDVFFVPNIGKGIPQKGVLFTTYTTMAYGGGDVSGKAKQTRLQQMVEWFGSDYDGVIVMDEAHNMQNAVDIKGPRGTKKSAAKARIGVQLQTLLPNARVVYASATGATEVYNLAFTERLGLWGIGTAFANVSDFITKITAGGIAAMELVARDMKAMGLYIARNLSYNGVKYEKITHNLTKDQTEIYDTLAESWQIVLQNINAALETIGVTDDGKVKNKDARKNATTQFWGAQQRFFNQVLTALQMPTVIAEAKKDLADGKSIVMQLVNTNEASQKRELQKMEENEGDIEDLDLTPREIIQSYLDSSFPVQQYEDYIDDKGNVQSRPVTDSNGDPVLNAEAVAMKEELMNKLSNVKVPEGPLEMVLNAFGVDMVAEVTGRGKRVIYKYDPETDQMRKQIDTRNAQSGIADADAFQNGPKRILMFSAAGGTGRSYHAERNAKNQQQRMHYLIQAGWEATKAVQGFGRTHRTNQSSAPVYKLFTTNLKGQMRFVSSIARRLDQLGALTKGQRETGSQGLFTAADNLESPLAKGALYTFYSRLARNQIPGLRGVGILNRMGLLEKLIDPQTRRLNEKAPELDQVPKFLNRILVLKSDEQNDVFNAFQDILNNMTEIARQDGTLDTGLENIKADKAKIDEEVEIRKDPETGALTTYNKLELGHKTVKLKLSELIHDDRFMGIYKNEKSKAVVAVLVRGTRTLENGSVVDNFLLQGAEIRDYRFMTEPSFNNTKYVKLKTKKELREEFADLVDKLQATGEWTKSKAYQKAVSELMPKLKDEFADLVNALQAGGLTENEANQKAVTELMMPLSMEANWDQAMKDVPEFRTEILHMISGTLLPIWDRLPNENVRVVRARTDDGKVILGRVISENAIGNTLHRLGAERRAETLDTTQLADKILTDGYSVILVNGWKLSKRKVSGEWRVEITAPNIFRSADELRQYGVFQEIINYDRRFFAPVGDNANQVLENIVSHRPIQEVIAPRNPNANAGLNANRSEEDDGSASLAAQAGKPRKSRKKPAFNPVQRLIEETKRIITPRTAEKLSEMLATFLGTTVYKGHVQRGAQGTHQDFSGVTNVTEEAYGEWRVVGHELGHAFSDFYRADEKNKLSGTFDSQELKEMAHELYTDPSKLKHLSAKKVVEEGFAEFFRQWVTDPALAQSNAPATFDLFTDFIASDPKLAKIMNTIRGMVDDDLSGSVFERTANGIISNEASEDVNYGEVDILGKQRAAFNLLDFTLPAKRIMDHLRSQGIQVKVDLAKLLALTGNAMSKAKMTFTSRPTDAKGAFIGGKRSLQTIMQEAIDVIGNKIGWQTIKLKTVEKNFPVYKQFKTLRANNFFEAILLANRVKERYYEGHNKLPMSLDMAEEILQIAEDRFPEIWNPSEQKGQRGLAEEFVETFSYIVLEKLERAGIITAATRKIIEEKSNFYIPMITDKKLSHKINGSKGSGRTTHNPARYFKGSVTPVLGAYNAVLIKLTEVESAIEHKRAFDALQDTLSEKDMVDFGRVHITIPPNVTVLSPEEVLNKMRDDVLELLADHGDLNDVFKDNSLKFFTPGGLSKIDPNKPIIMNIRDGKAVYMELHPDVYRMMLAMQPVMVTGLAKGLAYMSRATRHIALSSVAYLPNALARDVGTTILQSKAPLHTLTTNMVHAAGAITGWGKQGDALYNSFITSGAFNSAAENMITNQLKHINEEALIRTTAPGWFKLSLPNGKKLLTRVLSSPVAVPHHILKFNEELPRISEYVSMMKKGMAEAIQAGTKDKATGVVTPFQDANGNTLDAKEMWNLYLEQGTDALPLELQNVMEGVLVEAGYAASEVTTNFNLHGANSFVRQYVPTTAFLHGTMQGFYRTARQINDHKGKTAGVTFVAFGLLGYLAWMLMNRDDDDKKVLQDMDSAARDKYLWFPSGTKGIYIAIAKPFEYAIPMNMMERFFDHMSGDPQARGTLSDMKSLFSGLTGVQGINSVVQILWDMSRNQMSNGGNIIPMGEQKDAKELQYGPDTSLTARTVAKLYADITGDPQKGFSPRMMDYFLKQNFGKLAGGLLSASDFAIKYGQTGSLDEAGNATKQLWNWKKPFDGMEYAPFIGQVIRSQAEGNSRIVEDFYNQYSEVQTFSATAGNLITKIQDMAAKDQLVLPNVPRKMLTSESIQKLQYLPAMDYLAGEMNATRKQYAQKIADAPNAEIRRMLTLQKDYVEKLTAGLLYGFQPATPNPDSGITPQVIEQLKSYYAANAQKKMIAEQKTKGGVTDQVIYLTNMANMVK